MSSAEHSCKLFKSIFAYRQTVWTQIRLLLEEQSDLGPHCLQKWLLKSQADDIADDNCCDWPFGCFKSLFGIHQSTSPENSQEYNWCEILGQVLQLLILNMTSWMSDELRKEYFRMSLEFPQQGNSKKYQQNVLCCFFFKHFQSKQMTLPPHIVNFQFFLWPWKLCKGHQNLLSSLLCPYHLSMEICGRGGVGET